MIRGEGGDLKVEGVSQDELLLVSVVNKSLFFSLVLRDKFSVGLQDNQDKSIISLRIRRLIKFNSTRRMMSVVVQTTENRMFVFTKGADMAVLPLINEESLDDAKVQDSIQAIERFTNQGLRTLVYAYKEISEFDIDSLASLDDEAFESNLTLLGATGFEDKLHD